MIPAETALNAIILPGENSVTSQLPVARMGPTCMTSLQRVPTSVGPAVRTLNETKLARHFGKLFKSARNAKTSPGEREIVVVSFSWIIMDLLFVGVSVTQFDV
jgi:hypothetical protein